MLIVSLGVLWLNFLLTSRWANVDGSINGPKRPFFLAALGVATILTIWRVRPDRDRPMSRGASLAVGIAGLAFLGTCFFIWFPIGAWSGIPFLDDWPIRYQESVNMVRLLEWGAFAGWEWQFLGGYHSSSDVTQGLAILTYLPMKFLGSAIGFHVTHLLLFAAVPLVLWLDLSLDDQVCDRVRAVSVGIVGLLAANYSYFLIRSGDTNALGGVVLAMAAITGAHALRRGHRWGPGMLVAGLALASFVHPGFFAYACAYLLLDALVVRDARSAVRAALAGAAAIVASLPLTWESWRYPSLFSFNNLFYRAPESIDWMELARKIYYNVELLWLPGRWFNDYSGLAIVFLPVTIAIAVVDRSRVRFHALAAVLTLALLRFHNPYAGYVFLRPIHMLPVFCAPVLATLLVTHVGSRALRWSLAAVLALYVQVWLHAVPHIANIRAFDSELVDRIAKAPGALVLLENNPHRNMNADPGGTTEPSRFGVHFEPLIAAETGRRLYAGGASDGWQWNPWKGQLVAGGTFMGRALPSTTHDRFVAELTRWGVVSLFVWSPTTTRYLDADRRFQLTWAGGAWKAYVLDGADAREVVVAHGRGALEHVTPLGADVVLYAVPAGETVTVRTNFHPAWVAHANGQYVALSDHEGQVSFAAPCNGDCTVTLSYPRRRWLLPLALITVIAAAVLLSPARRGPR
jgi:hypothetical protein